MKDKSKKLLVINTNKKPSSTQSSGGTPSGGGFGGVAFDMSDYLLKAVWDRVFELKTDKSGAEYLFSKLPLATQYGITMYADGGELNLPDIYEGIPFDNKSIWYNPETKQVEVLGGNGSSGEGGVSNFWDLNGIPGWITNTKPTYNYSEIKNTPDLSEYVSNEDLKKYVSLNGDETINGLKNFTKGLQIDGLGISKSQDDVIYLDANLVVRGGITMFGTGEDVDVPTIMDALSVDGVNLQVINGVLTFVGEATGGVADSVRWENVIGRPTLLSSFTDDVVAGKYLPLSGGTLTGKLKTQTEAYYANDNWGINLCNSDIIGVNSLYFNDLAQDNAEGIAFARTNGNWDVLRAEDGVLKFAPNYVFNSGTKDAYTIWHSGNDGRGSGLDADLLDGYNEEKFYRPRGRLYGTDVNVLLHNGSYWTAEFTPVTGAYNYGSFLNFNNEGRCTQFYITDGQQAKGTGGRIFFRDSWNAQTSITSRWLEIITNENIGSQTVSKANQLTTARTIWGQLFDGTSDISGSLVIDNPYITWGSLRVGGTSYFGSQVYLFDNASNNANNNSSKLYFAASGYDKGVFLQGLNVASYGRKRLGVFVNNEESYSATTWVEALSVLPNGNVGIGTTSPSVKLDVVGNIQSTGTMYSSSFSAIGDSSKPNLPNINFYDETKYIGFHISYRLNETNKPLRIYYRPDTNTFNQLIDISKDGDISLKSSTASPVTLSTSATECGIAFRTANGGNRGWVGFSNVHGVTLYNYNSASYGIDLLDNGNVAICPTKGNVGIGIGSPSFKLDVKGGVNAQSYGGYNGNTNISSSYRWAIYQWNNELQITRRDSSNTHKGTMAGFDLASGNVVFEAGITMYSDQRKKTILNYVELSLKQIADAPLIEHYYNSDESKTTHVGSIAQYWAEMNDWFCKKDNEGFYTMEIQNAALASAISIARELHRYESKTDKKIRLLQKRIGELEDEIEKLKRA